MMKATSSGVIKFGEELVLTKEDLETIMVAIGESTSIPTLQKVDGIWTKQATTEIGNGGYRIIDI